MPSDSISLYVEDGKVHLNTRARCGECGALVGTPDNMAVSREALLEDGAIVYIDKPKCAAHPDAMVSIYWE